MEQIPRIEYQFSAAALFQKIHEGIYPEKSGPGASERDGGRAEPDGTQSPADHQGTEGRKNTGEDEKMKKRQTLLLAVLAGMLCLTGTACGKTAASSDNGTQSQTESSDNNTKEIQSKYSDSATDEEQTDSEQKSASEVKVTEYGYHLSSYEGSWYIRIGVVYKNQNTQFGYSYPTITFTGYDSDGKVVGTTDQTQELVAPQETQAAVIDCECSEKPEKVKVTMDTGNKIDSDSIPVSASDLKVSGNTEKRNRDGSSKFSGEVKNNSKYNLESAEAVLILKKDKKIVFGDYTFIDNLKARKKKAYTFDEDSLPDYDSYSVYVYSWDEDPQKADGEATTDTSE